MATGFVDRWKGKITVDAGAQWVSGTPLYGPASVQTISTVTAGLKFPNSTVLDGSTITNYGVTILDKSSAGGVLIMQAPSYVGQYKTIVISSMAGSSIFIKTGSTSLSVVVGINGSTNFVVKSTVGFSALEFIAISSASWAFTAPANSSLTHTVSTST